MVNTNLNPADVDNTHKESASHPMAKPEQNTSTMSKSMHDGVEVWCDCCSCEAEPYWIEAMKDYEILL
jgi:hypothetical protein